MKHLNKIILGAIFALVIAAIGANAQLVGAAFETTVSNPVPVFTGTNSTSTVVTSYTLVGADVQGYSSIFLQPNTAAMTLTLPASSTLAAWLPNPGNRLTIVLLNSTTTSAASITVAAGSGSLLSNASTSLIVWPRKAMRMDVMRLDTTDLLWIVTPTS